MGCGFSKEQHVHFQKSSHSRRKRSDDHKFIEERHAKTDQESVEGRASSQTTSTVMSLTVQREISLENEDNNLIKPYETPTCFQSELTKTALTNSYRKKQKQKRIQDADELRRSFIQQLPHPNADDNASDAESFVVIHGKVVAAWEGDGETGEKRDSQRENVKHENRCQYESSSVALFGFADDEDSENEISKFPEIPENDATRSSPLALENVLDDATPSSTLLLETNPTATTSIYSNNSQEENVAICNTAEMTHQITNVSNSYSNPSSRTPADDNGQSDNQAVDESVENIEKVECSTMLFEREKIRSNLLNSFLVAIFKNLTPYFANNDDELSLSYHNSDENFVFEQTAHVTNIWNEHDTSAAMFEISKTVSFRIT